MAIPEIIDIISILIGVVGAILGLGTAATLRNRQSSKGRGTFLFLIMPVLFIVGLIALVSTLAISGTRFANITLLIIILFTALISTIALVWTARQIFYVKDYEKKEKEQSSVDPQFDAKKNPNLVAYRNIILGDKRNIQIENPYMGKTLNVQDAYIKPKVKVKVYKTKTFDSDHIIQVQRRNYLAELFKKKQVSHDEPIQEDAVIALSKYKRCVVVGDPGSGKTTLLKHFILQACGRSSDAYSREQFDIHLPSLPILVNLNSFASSNNPDLLKFVFEEWDKKYNLSDKETSVYIPEFMKSGEVLLLLDGLDETFIGDEPQTPYNRVSKIIEEIAQQYQNLFIVVTTRKAAYQQQGHLDGFTTELELCPFRPDEIPTFVTNQFDTELITDLCNPRDLINKLDTSGRVRKLASNPLFLLFIIVAYQNGRDPAERRAILYDQCVESLLKNWDKVRAINRSSLISVGYMRQVLKFVAFQFHQKIQWEFEEKELVAEIKRFMESDAQNSQVCTPKEVLDLIATENGLLKKNENGKYQFLHSTFQEYFVAQYLSENDGMGFLLKHFFNSWWEEVVILYAAYTNNAKPLLEKLLELDGETVDFFPTRLILAGRCLATSANPNRSDTYWQDKLIEPLSTLLKSTSYSLTREQAAEALVDIWENDVALRDLLNECTTYIQSTDTTAEEHYSRIYQSIANALPRIGEHSWADNFYNQLIKPELQSKDKDIRESIAKALGKMSNDTLIEKMKKDWLANNQPDIDSNIRINMVQALGETRKLSVAHDLLSMLKSKQIEDALVLDSIIDALGTLSEASVAPGLVPLLSDKSFKVEIRQKIAVVLGKLGNQAVAQDMLRLLPQKAQGLVVRCSIASALSDLRNMSIISELSDYYKDSQIEPTVRQYIATTLCKFGESFVVPKLRELLSNRKTDDALGMEIAEALGTVEDRDVTAFLLQSLKDKDISQYVRASIAIALGNNGWDREYKIPRLLKLLIDAEPNLEEADNHGEVRKSIAKALGELGDPIIIPGLLEKLDDRAISLTIRESIADAVGKLVTHENNAEKLTKSAEKLATILPGSDIADTIHRALWAVSQRLPHGRIVKEIGTEQIKVVSV